jgi:hypothetical protein
MTFDSVSTLELERAIANKIGESPLLDPHKLGDREKDRKRHFRAVRDAS